MTNNTQGEIARLSEKLAAIYRLGRLTASEQLEVKGLWARIERLEAMEVIIAVKEANVRDALIQARKMEGME